MLQQTQVNTVIPYFQRFIKQFPTIKSLANAGEDEVLHLWTGLGYYSRARNLHKSAKLLCNEFSGELPASVEELTTLPGIGRSTAGAIVSIAFKLPAAILDGNVKRVLARHNAIAGWPGKNDVLKLLWQHAEARSPATRVDNYSQAMMDLGATVCTRSKPDCDQCPLAQDCLAYTQGNPTDYPGKKPKKQMPVKSVQLLMVRNTTGDLLLEKRPPTGIWSGLWIFPQISTNEEPEQYCNDVLGLKTKTAEKWPTYRHTFSHYHLDISPVLMSMSNKPLMAMEAGRQLWYNINNPPAIGMAAPIKKLIARLKPAQ